MCDANWMELAQNRLELLNAAFGDKSVIFHNCSAVLDHLEHGFWCVL
jgi:hypothetical protein